MISVGELSIIHTSYFVQKSRKQVARVRKISNRFEGFYRKIRSLNLRISKLVECGNAIEIYSLELLSLSKRAWISRRRRLDSLNDFAWHRFPPPFKDISWILRLQVTFLDPSIRAHRPFYYPAIRKISRTKKKKKKKRKRVDPRNTEIQIFDAVPRRVFDRESLATLLFQTQIRFTIYLSIFNSNNFAKKFLVHYWCDSSMNF